MTRQPEPPAPQPSGESGRRFHQGSVFQSGRFFRRLALAFALFLILVIGLVDIGTDIGPFDFFYRIRFGDDIVHFLLIGTLSALLALGFPLRRWRIGPVAPLVTCVLLAVVMTVEETSQMLFPSRAFSLFDMGSNIAGIFIMGEMAAWVKSRATAMTPAAYARLTRYARWLPLALVLLFTLFLAGIIFLADRGLVGRYFGRLYNYPYGDNIAHFLLLGSFSALLALAFPPRLAAPPRRWQIAGPIAPLVTCVVLAAIMTIEEFSQLLNPNRSFSPLDLIANYAGIFIMGEMAAWVKRRWMASHSPVDER